MSARELARVEVLGRVKAGSLALVEAATLMGVSYRQAKRLWRSFQRGGAQGPAAPSGGAGLQSRDVGEDAAAGVGADPAEIQRRRGDPLRADAGGGAPGE